MPVDAAQYDPSLRALFEGALDAVARIDAEGVVRDWSVRAEEVFGWSHDQVLGKSLCTLIVPQRQHDAFSAWLTRPRPDEPSREPSPRLEMQALRSDGSEIPIELSLAPLQINAAPDYIAFLRDLSEVKRTEHRLTQQALEARLLHRVTNLTTSAASFDEALQGTLRIMCQMTDWPIGHVWLPDRASNSLRSSDIWYVTEGTDATALQAQIRVARLERGEGLPGRIWQSGEPDWVADLEQETAFQPHHEETRLGVRGTFGFPVFVHDEIVAIVEFFAPEEVSPDPQLFLIVGTVGAQLGRVIERRRWEEERGRLAAIVESSSDAIIGRSLSGQVISWNEGARQMYVYTAAEAIGQPASLLLPSDRQAEEPEIEEAVRSGKRLAHFETIRQRKDGQVLDVSLTISPIKDATGHVVGVATIERDICQVKATQRMLEQREARIRLLLDSTGQAMYGLDLQGQCTFCNRACLELLGYESDTDLLGRTMHSLIHHSRRDGSHYPLEECSVNHCLQTGESTHVTDDRYWRADGTTIPIEYWASPIYRDGRMDGAVVVFEDVTRQRRAEQERSRLADIVDSSCDAIIGKSLSGTIVSWNRGAEQVYGYTAEEAIGATVDIILPAGLEREESEITDVLRHGRPLHQFETVRRCESGRLIDVSITVSPTVDVDGCVIGTSTIERDITQRKQRELELQHAKEAAEAASRAKSEFLANISHELRTPMNAIVGMVELSLGEQPPPLVRDYLQTARESTQILLALVNDLLDFSRMEAGRFEIEPEPFTLRQLLAEAIRTLSLRAHERGLELACYVDANVPDHLFGDGRRLRQIVMNLIGNAIKFTDEGEVVLNVSADLRDNDQVLLQLQVRDTGIGIAPEDRERIFKPFTQVDASTTRRYPGTGLGLAICRELAEKMGGRIWLDSTESKRTTFHCELRMRQLPSLPPHDPAEVDQLHGLAVLVVDDKATNRRILEDTFRQWAMNPTVVADGATALRMVDEAIQSGNPFSLVVVDAHVPEMDGLALIEALQARGESPSPTVLMLSSADRHSVEQRSEGLNVSAYLEKPISPAVLLQAVTAALRGAPPISPLAGGIRPSSRELSILVAEDTPANQRLVRAILEKRGHRVDVASNGREALAKLPNKSFDAVLMDVQMPTMDGLQATAVIRAMADPRLAHMPIVAITAHAMKGDRDRCLKAGMDAYISKPIDAERLIRTVESLVNNRHTLFDSSSGTSNEMDTCERHSSVMADAPETTLDLTLALRRLGGDRELLRDMAEFFLEDSPKLLDDLERGLATEDVELATRAAHSIKGLSANFGGGPARELAQKIEDACLGDDRNTARDRLPELRDEIEKLCAQLTSLVLS